MSAYQKSNLIQFAKLLIIFYMNDIFTTKNAKTVSISDFCVSKTTDGSENDTSAAP